jgi:hypothetical protein
MKLLQELCRLNEWYLTEPIGTIVSIITAMEDGVKTLDEFMEHYDFWDEDNIQDALLTAGVSKFSDLPKVCAALPDPREEDWTVTTFRDKLKKKMDKGYIYVYTVNMDGYEGIVLAKHELHGQKASAILPADGENLIDSFDLRGIDFGDLHDDPEISAQLRARQGVSGYKFPKEGPSVRGVLK